MTQSDTEKYATEIADLKAANAELARALSKQQAAGAQPTTPQKFRATRWTRGAVATVFIVVGAILAPVAVVSTWAHHQLTDTNYFVNTFAPLAEDPAVQNMVAQEAYAAVESHIGIDELAGDLFAGLENLNLDPRAQAALTLLEAPAVSGIKGLMQNTIHEFVASNAFATIWRESLRLTHQQLVSTATGKQNAVVAVGSNQQIQLELAPVIRAVKNQLVAQNIPLASSIPEVNRSIVIAEDSSIGLYLAIYQIVVATGIWLPWIMLLLLAAGVLIAPRRALALAWASGAVLLTMALVGSGIAIGKDFFALATIDTMPHDAATALYVGVLGFVSNMLVAVGTVAAAVLVVTLFAGPWRWARALRAHMMALITDLRRGFERRGITTGTFGTRLAEWRRPARIIIAAACAAFVLFVRPLPPSATIWLAVIALVLLFLLELLSRPDSDKKRLATQEAIA